MAVFPTASIAFVAPEAVNPAHPDFQILVIGAGQSGLSAGYHLRRRGLVPGRDFLIVDHAPGPGGAGPDDAESAQMPPVQRQVVIDLELS